MIARVAIDKTGIIELLRKSIVEIRYNQHCEYNRWHKPAVMSEKTSADIIPAMKKIRMLSNNENKQEHKTTKRHKHKFAHYVSNIIFVKIKIAWNITKFTIHKMIHPEGRHYPNLCFIYPIQVHHYFRRIRLDKRFKLVNLKFRRC